MSYPQNTWSMHQRDEIPYTLSVEHSDIGQELLEEFKAHARITTNHEDQVCRRAINRAVADLEDSAATRVIIGQVTEYFDLWPWDWLNVVHLHRAPVSAIDSIKYYDTDEVQQTWAAANYDTDLVNLPARIVVAENADLSSPNLDQRPLAVEINYQAGLAVSADQLDDRTVQAIFVRATWFYGPGRDLMPDVDPAAVERCWQAEISRLQWRI